jgi:hypothetical protein
MVKKVEAKKTTAKEVIEPQIIVEPKVEEVSKESVSTSANSKDNSKQKKKNIKLFLAVGVVILLLLVGLWYFSQAPSHRFSFTIDGAPFVSDTYTPSEFFKEFKASNNFIVSVDLVDGNATPWIVNSLNLWLIALNADKKTVASLVKTIDSQGNLNNCITNDANVLVSRTLTSDECNALLKDTNSIIVEIKSSNEDVVFLSKNKLEIRASSGKVATALSNASIKQFYPKFQELLDLINEKIGSIS